MLNKVKLGIGNYYGSLVAVERDGKFFLELNDYDGIDSIEISKKLFKLLQKELGNEH
jgi:hypothetical protein